MSARRVRIEAEAWRFAAKRISRGEINTSRDALGVSDETWRSMNRRIHSHLEPIEDGAYGDPLPETLEAAVLGCLFLALECEDGVPA